MEFIIKEQKELAEKIFQLVKNTKKLSLEKRSKERLEQLTTTIEEIWKNFEKNDDSIRDKEIDLSNSYFTEEIYETTKAAYDEFITVVNTFLEKIPKNQPANISNENTQSSANEDKQSEIFKNNTSESDVIIKRLYFRINRLEKMIANINESLNNLQTKSFFINSEQSITKSSDDIQLLLEDLIVKDNNNPEIAKVLELIDDLEISMRLTIHRIQAESENAEKKQKPPKLPPVSIVKFDGDYKKWNAFKNLFMSVIHENKTLSKVEKLRYLQTHLEGEPLKLINHLQLTNENYNVAFKLVSDRYNNTRKICDMYIDTLLDLPVAVAKSASSIKKMHDIMKECLEGIKTLNSTFRESAMESLILTRVGIKKLDSESLKVFESNLENPKETPSLDCFLKFLESRFLVLEAVNENKPTKAVNVNKVNDHEQKCKFCHIGGHKIYNCKNFQKLNSKERSNFVLKNRICKNCMNHNINQRCFSKSQCFTCGKNHHTLLHFKNQYNPSIKPRNASNDQEQNKSSEIFKSNEETKQQDESKVNELHVNHIAQQRTVLLSTAIIRVKTIFGRYEPLRALIDQGSQTSLISEKAAQLLALPRIKSDVAISALSADKQKMVKHKIHLEIRPHFENQSEIYVTALILPKLIGKLPNELIEDDKQRWANIILADPNYDIPGGIDIILGADIFGDIVLNQIKTGNPTAINTKLGWILCGPTTQKESTHILQANVSLVEIQDSLTRFWQLEEVNTDIKDESNSAENHYKKHVKRLQNGRYEVSLPFKNSDVNLGTSRQQALARFYQIERMLDKNPAKRIQYNQFMKEYIDMNHMILINNTNPNDGYYIPHHGVWKADNITTKLRVVFDASAITTNMRSLNNELLVGPTIQENLTSILTRWRTHKFVYAADIEKMYRQIRITEKDQKWQKIFWRFSPKEPLKEYQLSTVTYGTTSAPFLAIRTLKQLAEDESNNENYHIIEAIKNDFYVDDFLSGADTEENAISNIENICRLLKKGGFTIRKWATNKSSLIDGLDNDLKLNTLVELNKGDPIKTLGLWWNAKTDEFSFKIRITTSKKKTKRIYLSNMSKIFDPLGWLAPIIINTKLMIQELWSGGYNWDDELPKPFQTRWEQLENELQLLETIRIKRYIETSGDVTVELHGFADASEKAYAAVVYVLVKTSSGYVVTLLGAKSRVAPLNKELTIPRLELCGALLLTNYMQEIIKSFRFNNSIPIYYWTDSTIALAWIKGEPSKWKPFTAHRVIQIQKITQVDQWLHVDTKSNPADLASRGIRPSQIINNQLWWCGPSWLSENWKSKIQKTDFYTFEETKNIKVNVSQIEVNSFDIVSNFSSVGRLIRVVAYMRRFINHNKGILSTNEITEANSVIVKMVQQKEYAADIKYIKSGKTNKISNKLKQLYPYIDSHGILRVGGRLENLQLQNVAKHPILLPASTHLAKLLIEHAHKQTMHGGNQLTLAYVRQTYWITNAKCLVRRIIHNCVKCFKFKTESIKQLMGNLPEIRINPAPPFTNTGIDYAGPFQLKISKGRGNRSYKGFIAVFVCMVTKAVHLEVVSDLTTEAFIAAYKRFTSRRGNCLNIYSDNGKTFVGARNQQLKEIEKIIKDASETIAEETVKNNTSWHFIPPNAPHFGGIWEAGVKSMKHHLKRVVGEQILTFEEFNTVLCQIEACLNSRPMIPLSNDPSDMEALTPGHFLIGRPLNATPQSDISEMKYCVRWQLLTRMFQQYWKRWSTEYLSTLQQRSKWMTKEPNLKIGDLVLIKEDNLPPLKWSLGRIVDTHPGKDGIVRTASVRNPNGSVYKRPITKLSPLPAQNDSITGNDTSVKNIQVNSVISTSSNTAIHSSKQPYIINSNSSRELKDKVQKREKIKRKGTPIQPFTPVKIMMLLAAVIICLLPKNSSGFKFNNELKEEYNIQEFSHHPGIYFEEIGKMRFLRNEWNLVIYYNLITYDETLKQLEELLQHLNEMCHHADGMCVSIVVQCQYLMQNIKTSDTVIKNSNKNHFMNEQHRFKRGLINGVGFIANELFGILDARSAEKYESQIKELQINQNFMIELAKNHTSITDATLRIFKESTQHVQEELRFISTYIQNDKIKHVYVATVLKMILTMMRIQDLQDKILNIILDTHHGKLNPILLPPDDLARELKLIRHHISPEVSIPDVIDGNLADLYNLMTVKSRVTQTSLIFSVKIPLPDVELYEIFKLIPLPIAYNNEFLLIIPSTEYLIINTHRDHYYPLNKNELDLCALTADVIHICKPHNPLYSIQSNVSKCEVDLINHKEDYFHECTMRIYPQFSRWIQLSKPNAWIYAMNNEYPIDIVCNSRVVKSTTVKGQGIIYLRQGCRLKQNGLTISARNTIKSSVETNFFPLVNSEKVLKTKNTSDLE